MIGLQHYMVVSAILFVMGVLGIFINRKNVIIILMAIELILLSVNINLVAFSAFLGDLVGQVFSMFVLTVAAGEACCCPIGSFAVRGERVLVYDPKVSETCAMRAVALHNETGVVLAPGSVSVSDDGRLVSQSEFMPMLPEDEQLINYGEDSTLSFEPR